MSDYKSDKYHLVTSISPNIQPNNDRLKYWLNTVYDYKVHNMETYNDLDYWFNYEQGKAKREGRQPQFTIPMYNLMKLLIENLHYKNLYIDTRDNLASMLGCTVNKINSVLNKLDRGFIKWDKASKGNIRIEISPAYGYKCNAHSMDYMRRSNLDVWLSEWSSGK